MKPDDLKIGYLYKHIPDERIGRVERFNSDGTPVMYALAFDCEILSVEPDRLQPATLDDLAIELGGVKCWFVRTETDGGGEISLTDSSRNGVYWSAVDNQLDIALAIAAAVNAPVITQEQWKELSDG